MAWFAGWLEVMPKVAAERDLQVIAVDIRKLGEHTTKCLALPNPRYLAAPCLGLPRGLGRLGT